MEIYYDSEICLYFHTEFSNFTRRKSYRKPGSYEFNNKNSLYIHIFYIIFVQNNTWMYHAAKNICQKQKYVYNKITSVNPKIKSSHLYKYVCSCIDMKNTILLRSLLYFFEFMKLELPWYEIWTYFSHHACLHLHAFTHAHTQ